MAEIEYLSTSELVSLAKDCLHIRTPNKDMSDAEIRAVVRWIGHDSACGRCKGEHPFCQSADLILMLVITAVEFPRFFAEHELSEPN
jgi:hypothetical protein